MADPLQRSQQQQQTDQDLWKFSAVSAVAATADLVENEPGRFSRRTRNARGRGLSQGSETGNAKGACLDVARVLKLVTGFAELTPVVVGYSMVLLMVEQNRETSINVTTFQKESTQTRSGGV